MGSNGAGTLAYIGVGSNLGDRIGHLRDAVKAVKQLGGSIALSSVYETEPFGVEDDEQPMYLNMVVGLRTLLGPRELLEELLRIELANGRVRYRRNESRTLDLDVLVYGDVVVEDHELRLPHPRMCERAFVMMPLAEIAPGLVVPGNTKTVGEIAEGLADQGVRRIGEIAEVPAVPDVRNLA